jgi:hypothetical protein
MGSGLKPTNIKPACPKCNFTLKYYVWDPDVHSDKWVLSIESRQHLKEAHIHVVPKVRKVPKIRYLHRLPPSKRRALV